MVRLALGFRLASWFQLALGAATGILLAGCATPELLSPPANEHPLAGRIWDTRSGSHVTRDMLITLAAASRLVILGETHDNSVHHRLQAEVLFSMLRAGRRPALAMEQFDREHQPAIDAAVTAGETDPERIADAGRFERNGWRWPDYRRLVELALEYRLPLVAANFSRSDARALMRSGRPAPDLSAAPAALSAQIERDIVDGHCGIRPSEGMLAGMVEAQRARDARLATSMEEAGRSGAVLITGNGHARRDRGAPYYLSSASRESLLVIAFVEVAPDRFDPQAYFSAGAFDLIWFTPRAERGDPCAALRLRG